MVDAPRLVAIKGVPTSVNINLRHGSAEEWLETVQGDIVRGINAENARRAGVPARASGRRHWDGREDTTVHAPHVRVKVTPGLIEQVSDDQVREGVREIQDRIRFVRERS